jgi:sugar diacid utilization regulator
VWHSDLLLGFVWFVDSPPLSADGLAQAVSSSGELAMALYRVNLLGELAARREADAVRGLLSADASVRSESVTLVVGEDLLDSDGPTVALVATDSDPARLEQALVATRRWYGLRSAVHLARTSRGVVLLRPPATASGSAEVLAAAEYLAGQVSGVVGVGDAVASLADAATSVEQAAQAARIAVQLPAAVGSTRVAVWSQLGVYRILAAADLTGIEVHPGLSRLSPSFVATLEAYLDLAGDAAATAARLRVHRTTLYYRLARIEELTGADLRDGLQRLALHLAVKAAHLIN